MNRFVLFVVLNVAVLGLRPAEAQCPKWQASIDPCMLFSNYADCANTQAWSHPRWRTYYQSLYNPSAQAACTSSYKNHPTYTKTVAEVDGLFAYCWVDKNSDGQVVVGSVQDGWDFYVAFVDVPREPMCSRVPNGPYRSGGPYGLTGADPGGAGKNFSASQKSTLKHAHLIMNGQLFSDAYLFQSQPPMFAYPEPQVLSFDQYVWDLPDDDEPSDRARWNKDYVNVDHIIPRKDIYGCDCGPNTRANALLISAGFNVKMSNNSSDADRVKLLEKFTLPAP